jgi:hypothetical protein
LLVMQCHSTTVIKNLIAEPIAPEIKVGPEC